MSNPYQARMDRVASAIAAALKDGRSPELEELASAAALSPFHFHRVYRLLTGETLGQSIQRLKVTHALELVNGGDSVTGAALAAGYASSQSLAKAVRQHTGTSVTELRTTGLAEQVERLKQPREEASMSLEIVDHAPVRVACRLVVGPYQELNLGYRALFEDVCTQLPPEQISGVFGIPIDDPKDVPPDEHRFACALGVPPSTSGLGLDIELRELGGGRFALSRFNGPYAEVPATIDDLYSRIIAGGVGLGATEAFIHYVDQPQADDGPDVIHESHIYVPVEA
jgi:AraC family transcriptional regulator